MRHAANNAAIAYGGTTVEMSFHDLMNQKPAETIADPMAEARNRLNKLGVSVKKVVSQ